MQGHHLAGSLWPLCPACQGFLGWHPEACTTCRRYLEKYRPDTVVRVWGYDPRRGQSWADRLDHHGRPINAHRTRGRRPHPTHATHTTHRRRARHHRHR
jgi:hypothetical protein